MDKVYTRFQSKSAQKPYPMGRHIPIYRAYIRLCKLKLTLANSSLLSYFCHLKNAMFVCLLSLKWDKWHNSGKTCNALRYRVFSLTWPTSMQIYWNKRKCLYKKRVQLPEDWFGHQHGRRSLFWDTNMAAVTSHMVICPSNLVYE